MLPVRVVVAPGAVPQRDRAGKMGSRGDGGLSPPTPMTVRAVVEVRVVTAVVVLLQRGGVGDAQACVPGCQGSSGRLEVRS